MALIHNDDDAIRYEQKLTKVYNELSKTDSNEPRYDELIQERTLYIQELRFWWEKKQLKRRYAEQ